MAQQPGMRWYVLRAVSGKEAKVKEYLEALLKKDLLIYIKGGIKMEFFIRFLEAIHMKVL